MTRALQPQLNAHRSLTPRHRHFRQDRGGSGSDVARSACRAGVAGGAPIGVLRRARSVPSNEVVVAVIGRQGVRGGLAGHEPRHARVGT
jgi:hypothetical protein